ncbi:ABC transporter substrate-binding protein [Plantibacter sp. MPB07]|uniref:ABC transporter substrate-binding protein n=1 Tax=Plantibacter sp. MPB07 TaxID=3388853 RepID=UPI0039864784
MRTPKKWLLAVLAAVATGGLLSACTGPAASGGDGDAVFVVAIPANPPHFNMGITTDAAATFVSRAIYNPLVNLNKDYELVPSLAESWSANADSTEFTFNLVEDATWHDGEPFTSEDVRFYFDEMIGLHPLGAPIAAIYNETLTPDEHTAVVRLTAPFAPLVRAMTAHAMLPAHLYAGTDMVTNPTNLEPVGTGPYRFESFTSGESVTVTRNDDYWGEQGGVDRVVYQVMPDANARALAFQSGEVDLPIGLPLSQMTDLEGDDRFQFETAVMAEHLYSFFNTRNPVVSDPAVRAALFQAMDRDALAEKVFLGTGTPSVGPVPNQVTWAIDPSVDYTEEFPFDLDAAGEALDAAGYPVGADGNRFSLSLSYMSSNPILVGTAELIKANFAKIGVQLDLVGQEVAVYADSVFVNHQFDLTLLNLGAFSDPSLGVARAFVCNPENLAYRNPSGVCDDRIDAAFAGAAAIADEQARITAFGDAARANAEVLGTAPLISNNQVESYRADKWDGIEGFNSLDRWDWSSLKPKG